MCQYRWFTCKNGSTKVFCSRSNIYIWLRKSAIKKKISSNNKNKALINNLIDQIEFLKYELCCKDTIIKLIIENVKYNNEHFQNKSDNGSNQIE